MSPLESSTPWIFAFWIVTAALGAPLLLGALLGPRWSNAQRTVVRLMLLLTPAILFAGVLLPDPFEGRPLVALPAADQTEPAEVDRADVASFPLAPKVLEAEPPGPIARPVALPGKIAEANDAVLADLMEEQLDQVRVAFDAEDTALTSAVFPSAVFPSAEPPSSAVPPGSTVFFQPEVGAAAAPPPPIPSLASVEAPQAFPAEPSRSAVPPLPRAESRATAEPIANLATIRHPTALSAPSAPRIGPELPFEPRRAPVRSLHPIGGEESTDTSIVETLIASFLFIWAVGAIIGGLRVAASAWLLTRWRRTSNTLGSTRGVPNIDPTAAPLPVRIIPGLGSAAAVGVLSPEIWLPAHWSARLDRTSLHALLGHESAHHRGRDPLWRLLGACVVALLWPHPLVHSLRRREEHLSELEADRLVIASGAGPRRYAELLAHLAAETTRSPSPLAAGVLGTRSPLERRIRMILSTTPERSRRSAGWAAPTVLGALCASAIGLSACFPLVGNACDPVEEAASKIEFVLTKSDDHWVAIASDPKGVELWSIPFARVSDGVARVKERDGRYARVSLGNRSLLFDTRMGRMLEPPRPGLSIRAATSEPEDGCDAAGRAKECENSCETPREPREREERALRSDSLFGDAREAGRDDPVRFVIGGRKEDDREAYLKDLENRLARMEVELADRLRVEELEAKRRLSELQVERTQEMSSLLARLADVQAEKQAATRLTSPEREHLLRRLSQREQELASVQATLETQFRDRLADIEHRTEEHRHALLGRLHDLTAERTADRHEHADAHEHARRTHLTEQLDRARALTLGEADSRALRRALAAVEEGVLRSEERLQQLPDLLERAHGAIEGLERNADSAEHSFERALERLPEILARLEELPDLLETLADRSEAHSEQGEHGHAHERQLEEAHGALEAAHGALEEANRALEVERRRRANLEEENRALRRKLESLEKKPAAADLRSALMDQ